MDILSFYAAQRRVLAVFFIMESSFEKRWFSMTKTETVIRSILGVVRADTHPLAYTESPRLPKLSPDALNAWPISAGRPADPALN